MVSTVGDGVVLPVASPDDAENSCEAIRPYLADGERVIVVHVIEKSGGGIDKASVAQREERGKRIFEIATDRFDGTGIDVETRMLYGTDIARSILDTTAETDASVIAITPRTASWWTRLLTGDVVRSLMANTDRPLLIVPGPEDPPDR